MTHLISKDYSAWLQNLKEQIRTARVKASLAVNSELVRLYWQIGKEILERQEAQGWGAKVIDQLAKDLKAEFPDMNGLAPRNMKYMRAFAEAWPDAAIVQQAVAQLPWGHNIRILDLVKDRPTELLHCSNGRPRARQDP
jgi:predicted nuclease of restriction endonuclease-like (RecB) superfamily